MGEIADDHFIALFWSDGTGVGGDGGLAPPVDHPAYGGMDAYIRRHTARPMSARLPQSANMRSAPARQAAPRLPLMSVYDLLDQEKKLRPCPCCGAAARVIEYPLGVSCSRGACVPGKLPVYLSEKDAVEAGFASVVERWNTAELAAERDALVWPSKQPANPIPSQGTEPKGT